MILGIFLFPIVQLLTELKHVYFSCSSVVCVICSLFSVYDQDREIPLYDLYVFNYICTGFYLNNLQ